MLGAGVSTRSAPAIVMVSKASAGEHQTSKDEQTSLQKKNSEPSRTAAKVLT